MPIFQYTARDASGREQRGELSALNENDLIKSLGAQGFQVTSLRKSQPGITPAKASPPVVQRVNSPTPVAAASQSAPLPVTHSRPQTSKELFLFFTQLSNLLRSGITPAKAFEELSRRNMRSDVADACRNMAIWTTEGRPIHEAMAAYPELFPPGARGAMEAGALGGYLWEAAEMIAEQSRATHSLQKGLWYFYWACLSAVLCFSIGFIGRPVVESMIQYVNDSQGTVGEAAGRGLRAAIFGPIGVIVLLGIVGMIVGKIWMRMPSSRTLRHRLAHRMPMVKKRTINECFVHFSWHLSKMADAGVSPFASYQTAAKAVPNDSYSEELLRVHVPAGEGVRLSSIFYQTRLFPQEYAATVETGEMTGRVGESLRQASSLSLEEVKAQERHIKWKMGCWGVMIFWLSGLVGFFILYQAYLNGAFKILDDV